MSSLPKRRRVKRATILAKRSQLAKNNLYKKRSYKPLYEKLKANNNALAKALSKEKQECQYLFSEKIGLTSEIQELKVACNQQHDIISVVMEKSKQTLKTLATISNCVTNTLATINLCQQVLTSTQCTPRKSNVNDRRASSVRRLSGKSPARGVVQPMVSGHTITKPTINLSRLNIQREYRVQNPPNLSDIEENITPDTSPQAPARTTSVMPPIIRPLNYQGVTRVNRLPERIQTSMRASDESERRSSVRSNRNSGRHSSRRSRENSERTSLPSSSRRNSRSIADPQSGECLRSPRVALHDVSRLLHNSQSVNIRTLLENSSDMDGTQAQHNNSELSLNEASIMNESRELIPESSEISTTDHNITAESIDRSQSHVSENKSRETSLNDTEDPLEGPSWLLDSAQAPSSPSANEINATMNNSTPVFNAKDETRKNRTYEGDDESPKSRRESHTTSFVNSKCRNTRAKDTSEIDESRDEPTMSNPALRWANQQSNLFRNLVDNDDEDDYATSNLARFVNRKRGSTCDDCKEDFTLMMNPEDRRKNHFSINDLQLPILESPIAVPAQPHTPEPEQTTNIQGITTTHNFGNFILDLPRVNGDETFFNHTGLVPPVIGDIRYSERPSTIAEQNTEEEEAEEEEDDQDQDNRNDKRKRKRINKKSKKHPDMTSDLETTTRVTNMDVTRPIGQESDDENSQSPKRKRKRNYNKRVNPPDSPSDTEWVPTPKRKNLKGKRKPPRAKDPSSAKVVLQKLNDKQVTRRSPSPDPRVSLEFDRRSKSSQREASSDSDGSSNASVTTKVTSTRPRRQKAPTNLQEPSLGKKMRRL